MLLPVGAAAREATHVASATKMQYAVVIACDCMQVLSDFWQIVHVDVSMSVNDIPLCVIANTYLLIACTQNIAPQGPLSRKI